MSPFAQLMVLGVILVVVFGGLSLMTNYYNLNGIKNRPVGDGLISRNRNFSF